VGEAAKGGEVDASANARARALSLPHRAPSLDVQMTSDSERFMYWSTDTRLPLYVSPFFSSTSCARQTREEERARKGVGRAAAT
jgi:hypothetical protein